MVMGNEFNDFLDEENTLCMLRMEWLDLNFNSSKSVNYALQRIEYLGKKYKSLATNSTIYI